jgi:hypothetical protein
MFHPPDAGDDRDALLQFLIYAMELVLTQEPPGGEPEPGQY